MTGTAALPGLKSVPNFRDLAGSGTDPGIMLKSGLVFRSANPDRISAADIRILQPLGIRTVIDLRADHEARPKASVIPGATIVRLPLDFQGRTREKLTPVLKKKNYEEEVTRISEWLYNEITVSAAPVFRKIAELILAGDAFPVLIHCHVGKDRTGILSALVHLVAGSSREAIVRDFMLSNDELLPVFRKMLRWQRIMHLGFFPYDAVLFAIQARQNNIEAVLGLIENQYGGVEGYLESAGFDISRVGELRSALRRN